MSFLKRRRRWLLLLQQKTIKSKQLSKLEYQSFVDHDDNDVDYEEQEIINYIKKSKQKKKVIIVPKNKNNNPDTADGENTATTTRSTINKLGCITSVASYDSSCSSSSSYDNEDRYCEEDDEHHSDKYFKYLTNYYHRDNRKKRVLPASLPKTSLMTRRKNGNSNGKKFNNKNEEEDKIGLTDSFETDDTTTEEEDTTSLSTQATYDEDDDEDKSLLLTSNSNKQRATKIRWCDQSNDNEYRPLEVIHTIEYEEPATCRVVIFLFMNNNNVNENFEFLHVEFNTDERLKINDMLKQITQIVIGHPTNEINNNKNNNNDEKETNATDKTDDNNENKEKVTNSTTDNEIDCNTSTTTQDYRPFISLYYEGQELINALSIQDYNLIDGQSILVAIRDGKQTRDILLKQSTMLLLDNQLKKEIRKARIAGRSLQYLYSSKVWKEEKNEYRKKGGDYPIEVDDDNEDEREGKDFDLQGGLREGTNNIKDKIINDSLDYSTSFSEKLLKDPLLFDDDNINFDCFAASSSSFGTFRNSFERIEWEDDDLVDFLEPLSQDEEDSTDKKINKDSNSKNIVQDDNNNNVDKTTLSTAFASLSHVDEFVTLEEQCWGQNDDGFEEEIYHDAVEQFAIASAAAATAAVAAATSDTSKDQEKQPE